ncbi:hypothetical protein L3X38_032817 [Prunus dulcis]|uniref:RNase H type-1 domain-containing protein n=1 Tax=Prunus dulcis TaxID=3755 RepID=A0AAD4VET6_PRUDU|nr:hypothetical protein L3X38_032817 [Prunus dulcis]
MIPTTSQQNFDGIKWLDMLPHLKDMDGPNSLSKALLLCWQVWEARNNCVFKDIAPHPVRALHVAGQVGLHVAGQVGLDLGQVSINMAECLALLDGLAQAINNGWRKVLIKGDSKLVIDCINNKVSVPWSIRLLVQDIRLLSSYCEEISFHHVFQETNFTIDAFAILGHNLNYSQLWEQGLPLSCYVPFYFDLVGHACPRGFRL